MRATIALLLTVAATASASAQPARRRSFPAGADRVPSPVSAIIDARRQLNLTPRQLAQLDSIERAQYAARRRTADRVQSRRDSLCADRDPCELTAEQRAAFRDWVEDLRPSRTQRLRDDSLTRNRVMAILDSTQRDMVRNRIERRADGAPRGRVRSPSGGPSRIWEGPPAGRQFGPPGPQRYSERGFAPQWAPRGRRGPGAGPWGPPYGQWRGPRDRVGEFDDRTRPRRPGRDEGPWERSEERRPA